MNPRTKIILVVAGSIVVGLSLLATIVVFMNSEAPGPSNQGQFPVDLGVTDTNYVPYTAPTGAVPQSGETGNAIIAAYVKGLASTETLKVGNVVTAGEYALLSWADDVTGGEALLKFDTVRSQWAVVADTGGAFSVAQLRSLGVPQKTVLALLDAMR
jgi:hypothetical protein